MALLSQPDLAELLLASGHLPEAEALLRQSLVASGPAWAALLLARLLNDTGRPALALEVAAPRCAAPPLDEGLALQHVSALVALGRAAEACAHYRALLDTLDDPATTTGLGSRASADAAAAAHALGLAEYARGNTAAAAFAVDAAISRAPPSARLLHLKARCEVAAGRQAAAETALRAALQRDPGLVEAHNTLAQLTWMRTGDLAQATASFDAALLLRPGDDALRAGKAAILLGAGDARAAHECLAARTAAPDAPPALQVRAGMAALEFDPQAALAHADRALAALPGFPAARSLRCAALLGTGDPAASLAECESLLARTPDDQYLVSLQTLAWRLLGDPRHGEWCDYRRLVASVMLETPPGWSDLAAFLADLRTSLARLHDPGGHPLLFQSLRGGTETTQDLLRSGDPVLRALFRALSASIDRYVGQLADAPPVLRRRLAGRWRYNGSWSVRLRSQGYHQQHVHPRGWISSAFYVSLPPCAGDEGALVFGVPSLPTRPPLAIEHVVHPREGLLVLFPSYFWHGTVPFRATTPRLTVAFDVVPDPA